MKEYLGDGVYADTNGFHIILTTSNGIEITNRIYLEAEVIEALLRYLKAMKERHGP